MTRVTVHETKTHLSQILRRVSAGEDIIIVRGSVPVARLAPVQAEGLRELGGDRGLFAVPEDFDAPLPDDLEAAFVK